MSEIKFKKELVDGRIKYLEIEGDGYAFQEATDLDDDNNIDRDFLVCGVEKFLRYQVKTIIRKENGTTNVKHKIELIDVLDADAESHQNLYFREALTAILNIEIAEGVRPALLKKGQTKEDYIVSNYNITYACEYWGQR